MDSRSITVDCDHWNDPKWYGSIEHYITINNTAYCAYTSWDEQYKYWLCGIYHSNKFGNDCCCKWIVLGSKISLIVSNEEVNSQLYVLAHILTYSPTTPRPRWLRANNSVVWWLILRNYRSRFINIKLLSVEKDCPRIICGIYVLEGNSWQLHRGTDRLFVTCHEMLVFPPA